MAEISIPWAAWYNDQPLKFSVPDTWRVTQFDLACTKKIDPFGIADKLSKLDDDLLDKRPGTIVIVVDDLTRPVILDLLLQELLTRIKKLGYDSANVKILIGLGSHRGLKKDALQKKLGHVAVNQYTCINHNPLETKAIDVIWGKTPVKLNRHYLEADYKIVISGLTPHSFAGFSGGAKMLFPGLADMDTIAKTHKSVLMGFMGKLGEVKQNKFRHVIEGFVQKAGLDFFVGVVINGDRTIRNIHCGDYIEAHRQAAREARAYYLTRISEHEGAFDAVFLNAYPKDTELIQAENAFIPLKSAKQNILKENGVVVLTSACSEGIGHHGLFGPGGLLYRKPRPLRFLKERKLIFFSEKVTQSEFHALYHKSYQYENDIQTLTAALKKKLPKNARVGVFPYASLQLTG